MERRLLLAVTLSFLVILTWSSLFGPKRPAPTEEGMDAPLARVESPGGTAADPLAARAEPSVAAPPAQASQAQASQAAVRSGRPRFPALAPRTIDVETPRFRAEFSTRGGGIVRFVTFDYFDHARENQQLVLVSTDTAQPVLEIDVDGTGPLAPFRDLDFEATTRPGEGLDIGEIVFTATAEGGETVERRYRFWPDSYAIGIETSVRGFGMRYEGSFALRWDAGLPVTEAYVDMDLGEFASLVRVGERVEQEKLKSFAGGALPEPLEGDVKWAATKTKYFIAAIVAGEGRVTEAAMLGEVGENVHRLGWAVRSPIVEGRARADQRLYVGPILQDDLVALGGGIDRKVGISTMPLGRFFGWFARALYGAMNAIHAVIPNYGVSILILAVVTKLIFFPLTRKSSQSMRAMSDLKPKVDALREKHKEDPQRMNAEMLSLYKKHGVNPVAGCLPLLIQMPVFMALYGVLRSAIELRGAPFMLWIDDLSAPDNLVRFGNLPFMPDELHILPILMGATTIFMQRATMAANPQQKSLMYMMPFVMLFFFYYLPAGLTLYWTAQNLLAWAEQSIARPKVKPVTAKAA